MGNGHHCRFQKLFFSRDNGHIKYGDSYINGKNLHHRRTVVRLVVPCHHVILLSRLQIEIGSIRQIQSDRIPIHIGIEVLPFFIPFQVFNRYQIARIVIHLVKGSTGHWYRIFSLFSRDRQHILIGLTRDIRGAIYAIITNNVQLHITLHILSLLQLKTGVQDVKSLSVLSEDVVIALGIDHLRIIQTDQHILQTGPQRVNFSNTLWTSNGYLGFGADDTIPHGHRLDSSRLVDEERLCIEQSCTLIRRRRRAISSIIDGGIIFCRDGH